MDLYHWIAFVSLCICLALCLHHFLRLIRLGKPVDYSTQAGSVSNAIKYSFTGAMSPVKKESAFLHMPTYITGIIYHLGTFLSLILFFPLLLSYTFSPWFSMIVSLFLLVSFGFGCGLFIKRLTKKGLRDLSSPDDYISNALVTMFQLMTIFVLQIPSFGPVYCIVSALLWIYIPVGKLKHVIYFFAARFQLGYFYGWRGVWPPKIVKR
jgi:hypothetical protein